MKVTLTCRSDVGGIGCAWGLAGDEDGEEKAEGNEEGSERTHGESRSLR